MRIFEDANEFIGQQKQLLTLEELVLDKFGFGGLDETERDIHHHDDREHIETGVLQHPLSSVCLLLLAVQREEAPLPNNGAIGYS